MAKSQRRVVMNKLSSSVWVGMGGHMSLLMSVVWVLVQIRRKCWALLASKSLPSRVDYIHST